MRRAASERGYELEVSWLSRERPVGGGAHCLVHPGSQAAHLEVSYLGFSRWVMFHDADGPATIRGYFGTDPTRVLVRDTGPQADRVEAAFGDARVPIERRIAYPQIVIA
jgi:hypothetical protein